MNFPSSSVRYVCLLALFLSASAFGQKSLSGIEGTVTDPSGASVPNASVELQGPGAPHQTVTNGLGKYSINSVAPGTYQLKVSAPGFSAAEKQNVTLPGAPNVDVQLAIESTRQTVEVDDDTNRVSTDPASNGTALVLGRKELAALSDDPDELEQELQAMAGPGGGPSGGQVYIDGFTGGKMPPKSSIREVRINSNPYATEYDKPGFGRIEIFTKPGTDTFHGQAFFQFNDQYLNSRNPLLTESTRAPYRNLIGGLNLGGPIIKNKASFGFDFERRNITENAFVLATTLDNSLNEQTLNQAVVTPQTRTTFTPRIDYKINDKNTLAFRYQNTGIELDKSGVGGYILPSAAYNNRDRENTAQVTETAVLSPTAINETRFQFLRSSLTDLSAGIAPSITVAGAFTDGGATAGNSGNITNRFELTNTSTLTHGTHTIKWGARVRQSFDSDTSLNNFNGSYTFFGGEGPQLDSSNQPVPGTAISLTALQVYQRTLLGVREGLTAAQIRTLGGGASQFALTSGTPITQINQFDIGAFAGDDWRIHPNLTLSYGLRYETQTHIHDFADFAPRLSVAWGIGGRSGNSAPKTVLRAGFGVFYDRIADTVTLNAERYNGLTQQSYFVMNPDFYPTIPTISSLASYGAPEQLQLTDKGLKAPRNYQGSVGVDRQINRYIRVSAQYVESRGVHLQNSLNANAPVGGVYPFGDSGVRLLTETAGFSRTHQMFVSPNINYKKMFLFGFYALSYGKDNNEGQPADPNNLRAEWGSSSFADVRHRFLMGTMLPLPFKMSLSPFMVVSSGAPYNITTGQDLNLTGYATQRPSLETGVSPANCSAGNLIYQVPSDVST